MNHAYFKESPHIKMIKGDSNCIYFKLFFFYQLFIFHKYFKQFNFSTQEMFHQSAY